jgi:hypothetical protein
MTGYKYVTKKYVYSIHKKVCTKKKVVRFLNLYETICEIQLVIYKASYILRVLNEQSESMLEAQVLCFYFMKLNSYFQVG